ncbi:SDR family NAD(P)-dependent oxidoreductase [Dactylosporangium sp. NPDC000521]|uniref:SDR family NAD(P)-dependent oxidoreductase n=1 Tax=Dactylosporangium sp. NPDC000521 TaxID=3363975 RepID=UPI0036C3C78A
MTLAIVTGAAGGIGSAVAARLRADGYDVAGIDRAQADLTDPAEVERAFAGLGAAGVLVTCAGLTEGAPVHRTEPADWHRVLDANLTSAYLCARQVLPGMMAGGEGVIVTIGSVLAHAFAPGLPAYAAAKAGLTAFTRQLAVDYAAHGIRAVSIAPGWIRTPATQSRLTDPGDETRQREAHLGRLGTPEDVAAAVSYVVSPAAALLTGAEIVLDGGASAVQAASLLRPAPRKALGLPPLREPD